MKFKVGDEVKVVNLNGVNYERQTLTLINKIGKIIFHDPSKPLELCVEFYDNINGHNGRCATFEGKNKHCYWVSEKNVELTNKLKQEYIKLGI